MKKLVLLFFGLFLVCFSFAAGITRYVPGTYSTIQAAINAADPGDIIQVAAGNYIESLTVSKSDLTLRGAGSALTVIKTINTVPAIILSADNFKVENLKITNNRQTREGIRVIAPAAQGLTVDGVYFTNLGNDNKYAYGINIKTSMTGVIIRNSQFLATLASTNSIGVYAGYNMAQNNWLVENTQFAYVWVGVYLESSMEGLNVQNNNFGPWDLADCKQSASGLYIGDVTNSFSINNVSVTGNTFNSYARGVYFLNNDPNGVIGITTITNNIFTTSIWSSGVRIVAGTHSFGTYAPAVLEGPVTVCNNTFTQGAKIVNGSGVAMIDFRTVEGAESATSLINVCDNNITFTGTMDVSTWGVLLRGPLTHANVTGNSFIGNNVGGTTVNMPPTSAICVQTNYVDYGPMSANAEYNIKNNNITGFTNGISIYDMLNKAYGALPIGAVISANNNSIIGNTFGIYSGAGERTNARNNWWGTSTGPFHSTNPTGTGNPVTDYVDFLPWWCDVAMTTICPQPAPGDAILNTNTSVWYASNELGTAFGEALDGHILYVAPGAVNGARYNFPGKSVSLIGSGRIGESIITGPGRSLTISGGNLSVGNGLLLNTGNTPAKNIFIDGGSLKLRDCMLDEDPGSYQSAIGIEGGTVDAGTYVDRGNNLFIVNGPGAAMSNVPLLAVSAIGNDWGSTKGPKINTNPGGNGGEIISAGKNYVLYDPWRAGPVTVASSVKACNGETSVIMPVKVASFTNVGSLALQMNYDVTKLSNPVLSYQDPAFGQWGFLAMNTSTPGTLIITGMGNWPDNGISLADSATIFNLTFDIMPGTTTASVSFYEDPTGTSCEYTGSSPFFLKYGDKPQATHYVNGTVTYDVNPPVPVSVSVAASVNPVVPGSQVTITATPVNGGTAPSFQWKLNGFNAGTNSPEFTYTPNTGDNVKCIMTSNAQCVTGNPATSNTITIWVVETNINVTDTVYNSETNCYDASQVITVAGLPNTFLVKTGGSATLIAGQQIFFLPGTTVEPGGYMHAMIAPSGPFCPPPFVSAQPTGNQEPLFSVNENIRFKVYPNPTRDNFTIVQRGEDIFENVTMTVYSMRGDRVMTKQLSGEKSYSFTVAGHASGFYFIKLVASDYVETIKLIKIN